MGTLWFLLVSFMLAAYVVLDGFDLGAGIIHFVVGKTDAERRAVLRSIGPVWDGNEVWLVAAGGTLYFAFPTLYASSFSGFYLPLMMVLWLLMLRGLGVELRGHSQDALWHAFFDFIFSVSSALLAIFFGAALGNVIRGVPLNAEGYFFEPLWTTFTVTSSPGILDWYTVLTGLVALAALSMHGANYVARKTGDEVNLRARRFAGVAWWVVSALTVLSLLMTLYVRPSMMNNYRSHWWGMIFPLAVLASLAAMYYFRAREMDRAVFICSSAYLTGMLAGAAFALYPKLLPAVTDSTYDLTISNSVAGHYGLEVGSIWWTVGIVFAVAYFIYLYRSFRGKVALGEGDGY